MALEAFLNDDKHFPSTENWHAVGAELATSVLAIKQCAGEANRTLLLRLLRCYKVMAEVQKFNQLLILKIFLSSTFQKRSVVRVWDKQLRSPQI